MKKGYSLEAAKKENWYRTNILDIYRGGTIIELQNTACAGRTRTVYKIQKDSTIVIFKSMSCYSSDSNFIHQANKEYRLSMKASEITNEVAKPLDFAEITVEELSKHFIEIVYEYAGDDLLSMLGKLEQRVVIDLMGRFAGIMATLEANHIFHSDLKPDNVAILNDHIKLLDFGVSMKFNSTTDIVHTKALIGGTLHYLPPEVIRAAKGHPNKIDVFSWGMSFYQMITGRDGTDMNNDFNLRTSNQPQGHEEFLENIKKIKINGDGNRKLTKKVVNILLSSLDYDFEKRPSFTQIENELLGNEYYKEKLKLAEMDLSNMKKENQKLTKEIIELKSRLEEVTNERDELKRKLENGNYAPIERGIFIMSYSSAKS